MKKKANLNTIVILSIIVVFVLTIALYVGFNMSIEIKRNKELEEANQVAKNIAQFVDIGLAIQSHSIEKTSRALAAIDLHADDAKEKIDRELSIILSTDRNILYSYFASESKTMYLLPDAGLPDGYDPTSRPWYRDAKVATKPVWTSPYNDASTGEWIISLASKVERNSELIGVNAIDYSLTQLLDQQYRGFDSETYQLIIVTNNGIVVTHEIEEFIGSEIPIDALFNIAIESNATEPYIKYENNNTTRFASFSKVPEVNWTVFVIIN